MSAAVQSKPSSKVSFLASAVVVIACLGLGAGFIGWYMHGSADTKTIKLTPDDLAAMQSAGQRLTYKGAGGVPITGGNGRRVVARALNLAPQDPDGVFAAGNWQVIKAGQVQVRVQPLTGPPGVAMIFRQRNWGMLQDAGTFTIARRIVREDSLAKQLAVTPDQLTRLTAIVAEPPVHGDYLSSLPVDPADMQAAHKAWADYQTAIKAAPPPLKAAQAELVKVIKDIGSRSMTKAKQNYAQSAQEIDTVLQPRQVEAYRAGKTLTPLK